MVGKIYGKRVSFCVECRAEERRKEKGVIDDESVDDEGDEQAPVK